MNSEYLRLLGERVLVFDGAMGTQLMALELADDDFGGARVSRVQRGAGPHAARRRSRAIHEAYLEAGADVVETDSFTASRLKLDEYGLGERTREINRRAATLAREACDAVSTPAASALRRRLARSDRDADLVVRSGALEDHLRRAARHLRRASARAGRRRRRSAAARDEPGSAGDEGRDRRDRARVRARLAPRADSGAGDARSPTGRMLLGTDIRAVCATLDALPIDVIGLNCSTGPAHMRDAVRYLCENSRCFVSVIPNAGLPLMGPKGETIYPESPEEMARELGAFVRDFGVNASADAAERRRRTSRALREAVASVERKRAPRAAERRAVGRLGDDRGRARASSRVRCSSASASTRRARARSSGCCSRTTTTRSCSSRANKSRAARTCSTSAPR